MRVLITGYRGFLGRHLCAALRERGDTVIEWLAPEIFGMSVDAVIHAATCYGRKGENQRHIRDTNIELPLSIYAACCAFGVPRFINIHTALPRLVSPYSTSKCHLVDWLELLQGRTQVVNLVTQHFYGPGDDNTKFTGWLFERLRLNERVPLTPGYQIRDFLFVNDAVSAVLACLDQPPVAFKQCDSIEVGSGLGVSVRDFAEMAKEIFGSSSDLQFGVVDYRPNEVMEMVARPERMNRIGWQAKTNLCDGIAACAAEGVRA